MTRTTTRRAAIAALGLGAALTVFAPFASAQSVADTAVGVFAGQCEAAGIDQIFFLVPTSDDKKFCLR